MFKILGLQIGTQREWDRMEATAKAAGARQVAELSQRGMASLRNLAHNLPWHLNFESEEEAGFCYDAISHSWDLLRPGQPWRSYAASSELKAKYIGKAPIVSGRALTESDFESAAGGDINAALYISQVIFSENRERYAQAKEWFDDIPGFLANVSGCTRSEIVATFDSPKSRG